MKRLTLNIFTIIVFLTAIFSGFALVESLQIKTALGLTTHFWLFFHVTSGSAAILLLILQIILNRARIWGLLKRVFTLLSPNTKVDSMYLGNKD